MEDMREKIEQSFKDAYEIMQKLPTSTVTDRDRKSAFMLLLKNLEVEIFKAVLTSN